MKITADQARGANGILGISASQVASDLCINMPNLSNWLNPNNDKTQISAAVADSLFEYYTSKRIVFHGAYGVDKRPQYETVEFKGQIGMRALLDEVYDCARNSDDVQTFCIFNGVPDVIIDAAGAEWYKAHAARMQDIKSKIDFKVIVERGTKNLIGSDFVEYRYWPRSKFLKETIYLYGDKYAFFDYDDQGGIRIKVHTNKNQAKALQFLFEPAWAEAEKI